MNKKMSFILLLLCFGLLPSVAQASGGDMRGLAELLVLIPTAILSIFSLIDMAIFHKLSPKLTYLTPHSRLEIPIIIMMAINHIVYLILFEVTSSFLADTYNYPAHFLTIFFITISIIYFAIVIKKSRIHSPDSYRPPVYKPLKTTVITIIIINSIISLLLFLFCITSPDWIEIFFFGGFLVPIQLVASFIFLKKEFKKEYSYPEPPNIP